MTPSDTRWASRIPPAQVAGGAPTAVPQSTASTDAEADILAEACRPGMGEPVTIHVRPAVYERMLADARRVRPRDPRAGGASTRVPFVVDDSIPAAPGYEIHRAAPRAWT